MNRTMLSGVLMGVGLVALGACDDPAPPRATRALVCEVGITYCEP